MSLHRSPRSRLTGLGVLLALGMAPIWAEPQEVKPTAEKPVPAASAQSADEPYLFQQAPNLSNTLPRWWTGRISPDGKTLAVAAGNTNEKGAIFLYNLPSGSFRALIPLSGGVRQVAFSPDGQTLAAASFDNVMYLYDVKSLKTKATGVGHTGGINSVAFTSDGKRLITGALDNSVRVWTVPTVGVPGEKQPVPTISPFAILQGHASGVLSVAVSKDGKWIVSGGRDNAARIWKMPEPEPAGKIAWKVHEVAKTIDAALNPHRPKIVTEVHKVLTGHTNSIESVAISNDGKIAVTGSWDTTARSWNTESGATLQTFKHTTGLWTVAVSKDGKTLLTSAKNTNAPQPAQPQPAQSPQTAFEGGAATMNPPASPTPPPTGEVRTWDLAAGKPITELSGIDRVVSGLAVSDDGKQLLAVSEDGTARVWPMSNLSEPVVIKRAANAPPQIIMSAATSADGKWLAVGGDGKHIALWDLEKKEFRGAWLAHDDVVSALAFSPDGKTLVSGSYDRMLKFWDIRDYHAGHVAPPVRNVPGHSNWIFSVAFSKDGQWLASSGYDRLIRLWHVARWEEGWFNVGPPVKVLKGHTAGVRELAFTPDNRFLASAGGDRALRVWRLPDGELIALARGHKGAIRAVASGPDGKTFATGSEDKDVKLWRLTASADGTFELKESASFDNLGDMVGSLSFSPRGLTLSVGLWNGQVLLLDPALGKRRTVLGGHNDSVSAIAFTADGKTMFSGGYDRNLRIWQPQPPPPPPLVAYGVHRDAVSSIALSPDGIWAATGGRDGKLRIFDRRSGVEKRNIAAHAGILHHVVFSRDSQLLATAGADKMVRLWKPDGTALVEFAGHADEVLHVAFSPDGKLLASAGKDANVRIWRCAWRPDQPKLTLFRHDLNNATLTVLTGHTGAVSAIEFSPDGKLLASAGSDRAFRLWDATTWKLKSEIPGSASNGEFAALAFSPDGKTIALAHNQDQMISPCGDLLQQQFRNIMLIDAATGKSNQPNQFQFAHPDWITGVAWSSDGQTLITSSRDMNVRLWNVARNQIIRQFKAHEASIAAIAVDAEEELVATAGDDRSARLWNVSMLQTAARAFVTGHAGQIWFAETSRDGQYLVSGGDDRVVRLRTALPGSQSFKIAGSFPAVYSVAASPDGKLLASGHADGTIRIFDAATGKQLQQLSADRFRVWGLAFTPDSKRLVSGSGDWDNPGQPGTLKLWDVGGKLIREFPGATGAIFAVALSPDGKTLAAGGYDQTVRLWDLPKGELKHSLKGFPAIVRTVAFSIDGLTLVAGSHRDNTLVFWNTVTGAENRRIALPDQMQVNRLLYMPNGKRLAIAGNVKPQFVKFESAAEQNSFRAQMQDAGRITLWDLEKNEAVFHAHGHAGMALDLSIHPNENVLCSVGGVFNGESEINFWNVYGGYRMGRFLGHSYWCEAGTFLPDGRLFTGAGTANNPGELKVWNTEGIAVAKGFDAHQNAVTCAAFHPQDRWLATGSIDHRVILWDFDRFRKTGFVAKRILVGHNDQIRSVQFSPDGSILASSAENGTVILWNPETGEQIRTIQGAGERAAYSVAFSPDGKKLLTGAGKYQNQLPGEAKIWEVGSGKLLAELKGHTREVWTAAFSPDGKWIVTGAGDRNIRVFDAKTLELKHTLTTPTGLRNLCFAPDGKTLASCGGADTDTVVRLWDAENWREKTTLPGHTAMIFAVRFTPDGKSIVSAGKDGRVNIYDLPQKKPTQAAKSRQ